MPPYFVWLRIPSASAEQCAFSLVYVYMFISMFVSTPHLRIERTLYCIEEDSIVNGFNTLNL